MENLREFTVEVKYKNGAASPTRYRVRIKANENLKKIKRHITESLDIQGRVTCRDINFDDYPSKRLSDYNLEDEDKISLITDRRSRDLKQHTATLKLPEEPGKEARLVSIKIARTTTIGKLKHKIQDEHGIAVDEHTIHVAQQQKECHLENNVMQLPQPLEVRLVKRDCSPPSKPLVKKPQLQKASFSYGTPYDVKQSASISRRKGFDSSIHPKTLTKPREKEKQGREGDKKIYTV